FQTGTSACGRITMPLFPQNRSESPEQLIRNHYSEVAEVVARRPGHDGIAQSQEKRERVECGEGDRRIEAACAGAHDRGPINDGPRRGTVAIDAVGSGTENRDVLSRNLFRASQRELLVASAGSAIAHLHRDLTRGDETNSRYARAQLAQARQQVF